MLLVIVVIVIVVWPCRITGWLCPGAVPGPVEPTDTVWSEAPIEFNHDSVIALTQLTNGYSENFKTPKDDNFPNRTGFLVQLGKFQVDGGSAPEFSKVVFLLNGNEVGSLTKDEFTWIDIIGETQTGGGKKPLKPQSAEPFRLWPGGASLCANAAVDASCLALFEKVNSVLFPACDDCGAAGIPIQEDCLRLRKIHGNLEVVTNIVTIWQGDAGLNQRLDPVGVNTLGRLDSRFYMDLNGDFELEAYLAESDCKMTKVAVPNDYDRVVFHSDTDPGTGGGVRVDPPWP